MVVIPPPETMVVILSPETRSMLTARKMTGKVLWGRSSGKPEEGLPGHLGVKQGLPSRGIWGRPGEAKGIVTRNPAHLLRLAEWGSIQPTRN